MKTVRKGPLSFASLPRDYASLCRVHLPRPIHDQTAYENTRQMAEAFAGFEEKMNADQNDYFEILTKLMEEWEATEVKWAKLPPLKLLQHLLDENGMSGADLSRLLGASRHLGPMVLRGERSITAEHARTLGERFGLPAGAFI